jgi:hypothetical protein
MSLSQKIVAALDARIDVDPLPDDVAVEDGPHRLLLHLTADGKVGLGFTSLEYKTADRPAWSTDALRAWGDRLTASLTYLMEPLVVLEVDPVGGEVALRSQEPTERSGQRSYYEIRLNQHGELRLGRVAFDAATRQRRAVACQLTREVLERLTDDLVSSVQ